MLRQVNRLECSFCARSAERVERLIAGPRGVYICDACVTRCNQILADRPPPTPGPTD